MSGGIVNNYSSQAELDQNHIACLGVTRTNLSFVATNNSAGNNISTLGNIDNDVDSEF